MIMLPPASIPPHLLKYFGPPDPARCRQGCFLCHLRLVMAGLKRVLREDGLAFVELADSYAGSWGNQGRKAERGTQRPINGPMLQPLEDGRYPDKGSNTGTLPPGIPQKSLLLVPERFRLAMLADGWVVRSVIRWAKVAPMPESVTDRPTSAVSEVVMLAKQSRYYSDMHAVREKSIAGHSNGQTRRIGNGQPNGRSNFDDRFEWSDDGQGRNIRNWTALSPEPSSYAHYASFGPKAIAPFLKLATSERGACAECGAAWERVTEKTRGGPSTIDERQALANGNMRLAPHLPDHSRSISPTGKTPGSDTRGLPSVSVSTTGWRPRCTCGLPESSNVPCRTLDCFGGSGTVGVVSEKLGLDCTLIDLNPDYTGMAALRLQLEGAPLFNQNGHANGTEPELPSQVAMFGDGR